MDDFYDTCFYLISILSLALIALIFYMVINTPSIADINSEARVARWCVEIGYVEIEGKLFNCKPMKRPEFR